MEAISALAVWWLVSCRREVVVLVAELVSYRFVWMVGRGLVLWPVSLRQLFRR